MASTAPVAATTNQFAMLSVVDSDSDCETTVTAASTMTTTTATSSSTGSTSSTTKGVTRAVPKAAAAMDVVTTKTVHRLRYGTCDVVLEEVFTKWAGEWLAPASRATPGHKRRVYLGNCLDAIAKFLDTLGDHIKTEELAAFVHHPMTITMTKKWANPLEYLLDDVDFLKVLVLLKQRLASYLEYHSEYMTGACYKGLVHLLEATKDSITAQEEELTQLREQTKRNKEAMELARQRRRQRARESRRSGWKSASRRHVTH